MNWLPVVLLFVTAWLATFAGTQFPVVRDLVGTPLSLLPALVVYAAFQHSLGVVTSLSVVAGLWFDALSGSPLGVSVAPLFLAGFLLHQRQHLLLRRHAYAQFWLGLFTGIAVPLATGILLRLGGRPPYLGAGSLWSLAVGGLANGVACPAGFLLMERLRAAFEYQPVTSNLGAAERQMKRGRH